MNILNKEKAMKTMKKFLSMAALALVGAVMTGCSGSDDDSIADTTPQPNGSKGNVEVLTTTVGFDNGAATRALAANGVKTFAEGDEMAVIYTNTSGETVKAVGTITAGAGTASATFTFELTDPKKEGDVTYIYPAAMAGDDDVDYSKLDEQEGGTLGDLGSKYDLCTKSGAWDGGNLPSLTLENKLAILAITLKKHAGDDFTSSITSMTVSDGTNTYTVEREAAAGPIYVAIRPTDNATIDVTATNATRTYTKTLTAKTYAASNGYSVSWKMDLPVVDLATCEVNEENIYTVTEDMVITGTPKSSLDYLYIYTDGNPHEITLDNVKPADMAGRIDLYFSSSMTIKLKGESRLNLIQCGGEVTIDDAGEGDGTLIVIDDVPPLSGNIIINSGTVKAKETMMGPAVGGSLTVNGGAVYLAGGGGERAVAGGIDGNATVYGWRENYGWISKEDWMFYGQGLFDSNQYITTDAGSEDPTSWNWDW